MYVSNDVIRLKNNYFLITETNIYVYKCLENSSRGISKWNICITEWQLSLNRLWFTYPCAHSFIILLYSLSSFIIFCFISQTWYICLDKLTYFNWYGHFFFNHTWRLNDKSSFLGFLFGIDVYHLFFFFILHRITSTRGCITTLTVYEGRYARIREN